MHQDDDTFDDDTIEDVFYKALGDAFTDEELSQLEMEDATFTVFFTDGTSLPFHQVDSNKVLASLARHGFAQMMDVTGARITLFAHGIMYMVAEGSQHE